MASGGSMSKRVKEWRGQRHKIWQLTVFRRDNYRCVICGCSKNLTADHIKPRVTHPELFFDLQNGRTLCDDCRVKDMLDSILLGKFRHIKKDILYSCDNVREEGC